MLVDIHYTTSMTDGHKRINTQLGASSVPVGTTLQFQSGVVTAILPVVLSHFNCIKAEIKSRDCNMARIFCDENIAMLFLAYFNPHEVINVT